MGAIHRPTANIIAFPHRHQHGVASRAASDTSTSAVTPASRTLGASSSAPHQWSGMRSLCCHLRAADTPAPMSAAMASGEGHSPMMERNETIADMPQRIGQFVPNGKPNVSHDCEIHLGHCVPMGKSKAKTVFKDEFTARVKTARLSRNWTQGDMAEALGMEQGKYKQYEGRSYLPHELVERFCLIVACDISWLYTGQGAAPGQVDVRKPTNTEVRRRAARNAA